MKDLWLQPASLSKALELEAHRQVVFSWLTVQSVCALWPESLFLGGGGSPSL